MAGGGLVATALAPERASAYTDICGHTYTTGECPHPFGKFARTDVFGYPVHPIYGYPVDDDGRDLHGSGDAGAAQGLPGAGAGDVPLREEPAYGGGWTRCCNGRLRHIQDCCSPSRIRINGDASVTGYCPPNLRVFCITYRELEATC